MSNNTSNRTLNHDDSRAHISHKYLQMNNAALNVNKHTIKCNTI